MIVERQNVGVQEWLEDRGQWPDKSYQSSVFSRRFLVISNDCA